MKKKLNLFCVLMLVVLSAEIVISLVLNWDSFVAGWRDGAQGSELSADFVDKPWWLVLILAGIVIYFGGRSFISFVRFILNVNRNQVFVWENVRLLRWTGWGIVITVVACVFYELFVNVSVATVYTEYMDVAVFGVFSLITSEVFAIGLKLKEEQDLTI